MTQKTSSTMVEPSWVFDHDVAGRFQQEAQNHIPDYDRVIDLCWDCVQARFGDRRDLAIVDVGSALGHTMHRFIQKGYQDVHGIDNSVAMIQNSLYPDLVTNSDKFVGHDQWHVVLANWTLHFVQAREQYLADIYRGLRSGGMLIVSDKMDHSAELETLYHDFKRSNGVLEETIQKKKKSLVGVLETRPLSWYLDTLQQLGFQDIQVINSRFMFTTVYATKP
jgi:trans-aconitate methyltransferase